MIAEPSRPRLLMLTHRFPYPPNRGDRIRSYNLLRVLARDYDVHLGCVTDENVSSSEFRHLTALCKEVALFPLNRIGRLISAGQGFLSGRSLTEGMFASRKLHSQVVAWQTQQPFDVGLVFCSSMFPYVAHDCFAPMRTVVDLVDVDSRKWEQMSQAAKFWKKWIFRREAKTVRTLEERIGRRADAVTLVSDSEAALFIDRVQAAGAVVGVSNGVDTDYFSPKAESRDCDGVSQPLKLVFTGVLDYEPNVSGMVWFCRQILPELRKRISVEVSVVGRRPTSRIVELDNLKNVEVVGEVPDVRPFLHAADVAISPLKLARGIQNKVLEAMACGLPVVTTSQSAEGIDAISGQHLLIADDVEQWCSALAFLSNDSETRAKLARGARQLVVNGYSWTARLAPMRNLLAAEPVDGGSPASALPAVS